MSNEQKASESATQVSIEEQITEIEASLDKIKQRYQQIEIDNLRKTELIEQKSAIKEKLPKNKQDSLKSELQYIEDELNEIEVRLESELFKWSNFIEPFWQIVRFVGIGIVIGWFLNVYNG